MNRTTTLKLCLALTLIAAGGLMGGLMGCCTQNEQCGAGLYCSKAPEDCDAAGLCAPVPELCVLVYDPVCGCDGETYSNACGASSLGVNVAYEGRCQG